MTNTDKQEEVTLYIENFGNGEVKGEFNILTGDPNEDLQTVGKATIEGEIKNEYNFTWKESQENFKKLMEQESEGIKKAQELMKKLKEAVLSKDKEKALKLINDYQNGE